MKRHLFQIAKIAGALWAVWLLWRTLTRDGLDFSSALSNVRWWYLLLAFCIYGGVQLVGAWRWGIFLRLQGVHTGFWRRVRVVFVSGALNLMIWGGVGGDVVRVMHLLPGQPPENRLPLAMTVVLDRFMGVLSLCLISSLTLCWLRISPATAHLFDANPAFSMLSVCVWGITGSLLLLGALTHLWRGTDGATAENAGFLARQWLKFREVMGNLWSHPQASLHALILSLGIHLLLGVSYYCLGRGFGETNVSFLQYIALAQLSNATAAVPLTPGGIGLRDFVAYLFLTIFQASPASVCNLLPVAYTAILLIWGIGALVVASVTKPSSFSSAQ